MPKTRLKRVLLALGWQNETLAKSLAHYAQQAGWHLDLQIYSSGEVPRQWRGEGIVTLLGGRRDLSRFVCRAGVPAVCLTLNEPHVRISRVDFDAEAMGRMAAEHFLEKRFSQFACYSYNDQLVDRLRYESFARRLKEAGYECRRLVWQEARGKRNNTWAERLAWLTRSLKRLAHPLAVFCIDDTVAVEVIDACTQAKLNIPLDVAVLGIGNLELYRMSTPVPLSSVVVDFERLAFEGAVVLDRLMSGKKPPTAPVLIAPDGIAARRSTDTIAAEHQDVAAAVQFMLNHFPERLSVAQIVAATAESRTGVYDAFRKEFGKSPMTVLRNIRLEKAKQMLRETDLKIRNVAKACGFGDAVNLYRLLLQYDGLTANAYRRKHKLHKLANSLGGKGQKTDLRDSLG